MESKILLIDEVAIAVGMSVSSIRRWLRLAREGKMIFPAVISQPGAKLRWLASDIEMFLQSRSNTPLSIPVPNPVKQRQGEKDRQRRNEIARQVLERHALGRKPKAK